MEKINIAELLKDCPKGMELYSPIFGYVYLDEIRPYLAVVVRTSDNQKEEFFYDGRFSINGECMLFPSKKNRDWSIFQRPFKDGDIITTDLGSVFILKEPNENVFSYGCYVALNDVSRIVINNTQFCVKKGCRLATEEEKQKLFDAIRKKGYKWNNDAKALEKLEVNKFDITTLKPFESRVLVRGSNDDIWKPAIWGIYNDIYCSAYPYITTYGATCQCIPYEGNEHLLGTNNDCDDYYKTWK